MSRLIHHILIVYDFSLWHFVVINNYGKSCSLHISISIKTLNTLQKYIFILENNTFWKYISIITNNSLTFFITIVKHGNLYLLLLSFYPAQLSIQLELCILFDIPISMPNKIDYLLNHDKNISNLFWYSFYPSPLLYIMQGFYLLFRTLLRQLF